MCKKKYEKDNFSKILKLSITMFILITFISIGLNIYFNNAIKKIYNENLNATRIFIQNIKIGTSKNNYRLFIDEESSDQINALCDKNYREFIIQYNENQANWLNTWLTILSIILGLLGLIIPICFMKLYQDKKDEIDKLIDKIEQQKNTMELHIKQSKTHKLKMDEAIVVAKKQKKEMQLQVDEVNQKSQNMSKELEEMKSQVLKNEEYLKKIGSFSNYTEAISILNEKKFEKEPNKLQEAIQLLQESIKLNPQNDKALYKLGIVYSQKKDYKNAIFNIKMAIEINEVADYFYDLGIIYEKQCSLKNATANILNAIEKEYNVDNKAFYSSVLAIIYAEEKDKEKTLEAIQQTLKYNSQNIYVYNNLSNAYIKLGQYEQAVDILKRALKIRQNASSYYNLTEACIFDNKYEDALLYIKKYRDIQDKRICYGIYTDDYIAWTTKLNSIPITPTIEKIKELMEQLQKRERDNEE